MERAIKSTQWMKLKCDAHCLWSRQKTFMNCAWC